MKFSGLDLPETYSMIRNTVCVEARIYRTIAGGLIFVYDKFGVASQRDF
jgi:hypothetical protein